MLSIGTTVLIQIARAVTLTLQDTTLQALRPGEIYDVAPAIGRVLVTDGWAREVIAQSTVRWHDPVSADDRSGDDPPGL
ncbi:MAG: hypothetical protein AB7P99_18255 [Vicinamibacterales bacterium]